MERRELGWRGRVGVNASVWRSEVELFSAGVDSLEGLCTSMLFPVVVVE